MRKLVVACVALTAAAALVVMGLPALAAGGPRSFKAHSKTVRAGQLIKVSGKGCGNRAFVRFYLNGFEIDTDRADAAGDRARDGFKEIAGAVEPSAMRPKRRPAGPAPWGGAGCGSGCPGSGWPGLGCPGMGSRGPAGSATAGCCWSWSPWRRSWPWSTGRPSRAPDGLARGDPASSAAGRDHRAAPGGGAAPHVGG